MESFQVGTGYFQTK